ncbi:hypothetical protein NW759_016642 [Fusarium solani]|nr:hypothetical protein NW759_016642 [Fusarium solani]
MSSTSPSSAESAQPFLAKLPFITLPFLILIAFSCPPFRGRGIIFACLLVANDYACTFSPWPPNAGAARPMRYGMATSWFFVLPALERLLLHTPELDFWLLDREGLANNGHPKELTWGKVRWAAKLVTTPRAVGWNFGHRKVNDVRARIKIQKFGRLRFAMAKLAWAVLAYITLDTVILAARNTAIPAFWAWDLHTIKQIVYVEALMGLASYSTMTLQFESAAMISVVLAGGQPEDWPPLFGNIAECYTVSNVWGKVWHGYIHQPVLGISHAIIDVLQLPRRSLPTYFLHLVTAFLTSGFFHIVSLFVICEGYLKPQKLVTNMGLFFMAQPLGTITEYAVVHLCQKAGLVERVIGPGDDKRHLLSRGLRDRIPHILLRGLGYTWVFCWFVWTGWWFTEAYAAVGVLEWAPPVSIWQ